MKDNEVEFLLRAGVMARERWPIREGFHIRASRWYNLRVPLYDDTPSMMDLDVLSYTFVAEEEEIVLETLVDRDGQVIRLGWGPRSNVLAYYWDGGADEKQDGGGAGSV